MPTRRKGAGVETTTGGESGLSADEQMRQKYEALRQDNTIILATIRMLSRRSICRPAAGSCQFPA